MKGFEGDDVSAFTAIHRTVSSYSRDRRKKNSIFVSIFIGIMFEENIPHDECTSRRKNKKAGKKKLQILC